MRKHEPINQIITATDARRSFVEIIQEVSRHKTRVVVEEDGTPLAAIVSTEDLEKLRRFEQQREDAFRVIDELRAAFADVPEAELEAEVDNALAEVRAEMAAEARAAHPPK